jgi:hypothetical protein
MAEMKEQMKPTEIQMSRYGVRVLPPETTAACARLNGNFKRNKHGKAGGKSHSGNGAAYRPSNPKPLP